MAFIKLLILKEGGKWQNHLKIWEELPVSSVTRSRITLGQYGMKVDIIPDFGMGSQNPYGGKFRITGQRLREEEERKNKSKSKRENFPCDSTNI